MKWKIIFFSSVLFIIGLCFGVAPKVAFGATSPYDVPSNVSSGWSHNYGGKMFSMTSGKDLVYDVYSHKYTPGGYKVINENFGKGYQPYINFQGWAVLFGYHSEWAGNNEVYIVAQKTSGSGVGTTKVYSTLKINLSATTDLEYNNLGSGLYNPCSNSTWNKNNTTCNMSYDDVGFNAYIPLKELFPNGSENATWKLFIVKTVWNQVVYTPLILPFKFNNHSYNNGTISLSSGVNAQSLQMYGTGVLRRAYPRQTATSATNQLGADRFFTLGKTYTEVASEETKTAVWYGVRSPKDGNVTKWAATAYWNFGGGQAVISYYPPPILTYDQVLNARYVNGNNYWYQPGDQGYARLEQRDSGLGNNKQFLRLLGMGQDVRSTHLFGSSPYYNDQFKTSSRISINSAYREINTNYGQVKWGFVPKYDGDSYDIQYYLEDKGSGHTGYNSIGKTIKVDGKAPTNIEYSLYNYRYQNGGTYWYRPYDQATVYLNQYDNESGNQNQYIRLYGSGQDVRSQHNFDSASNYNGQFMTSSHVQITAAQLVQGAPYGRVRWTIVPKANGDKYNLQYLYTDHVGNAVGYVWTPINIATDGAPPSVQFRNTADTANYDGRGYSNNTISVRLKFSDSGSGYKESRYAWTQSTATPTSWSNWTTSSNYVVSHSGYGKWYLHVEPMDNVGNVATYYRGSYNYNDLPVAGFTPSPNPTNRLTPVHITSTAYDPDGNPLTYQYSYEYQGTSTWTQFSTGSNPTYTFPKNGTYTILQTVTDSNGGTSSTTRTVTVVDLPPKAGFTATPNPTNRITTVKFTNKASDPENDALQYQYFIRIKGTSSWTQISTSSNPSYKFPKVTTYEVMQKVTDAYGKSDSAIVDVVVNDLAPTAAFTANPNPTNRLTTVSFSNQSADPEGDALGYKWYYQKSGTSSWTQFSTSRNTSYKFPSVATYTIKLVVTDSFGESTSVSHNIIVKDLAPNAGFTLDKSKYYIGDTVKVTSQATDPENDPLTYQYVVTDPTGNTKSYTTSNFSFKLDQVGQYKILQTVKDNYGLSDTAQLTFTSNQLTITGHVTHTDKWTQIHTQKKDPANQFYSGEKFMLSADITSYPANYVRVYFIGNEVDGDTATATITLSKTSSILYSGAYENALFLQTNTMLAKGYVPFKFEVQFTNGIVRTDTVNIQIIGNVYDSFFHFHESY